MLTNNCETAIMLAAQHGSLQVMELLIDDSDLSRINLTKNNCLHLALISLHENCALYFLDKINDPVLLNQTNSEGETALHLAASNGYGSCVDLLLAKGNLILTRGLETFSANANYGTLCVIRIGASIWVKNKKQQIPLLACAKNDQVANCLELMLMKLLHTIQVNDTSLTNALLNNDVNMLNNLNSTNIEQFHMMSHIHNNTCSTNTMGKLAFLFDRPELQK